MPRMSLENNLKALISEAESASDNRRAGLLLLVRALVRRYDFSVAELGVVPFTRKNPILVPQELDAQASVTFQY